MSNGSKCKNMDLMHFTSQYQRREKYRRSNDQRVLERINRRNSRDFGELWNEACSVKQTKRSNDTIFEEIIRREKNCASRANMAQQQKF